MVGPKWLVDACNKVQGQITSGAASFSQEAVAQGETVTLVGFGSFKASGRASREGKNPKTGEKIHIPETTVPKFSAGATFKARVAGKDA